MPLSPALPGGTRKIGEEAFRAQKPSEQQEIYWSSAQQNIQESKEEDKAIVEKQKKLCELGRHFVDEVTYCDICKRAFCKDHGDPSRFLCQICVAAEEDYDSKFHDPSLTQW